jgi:gluconate kinase
MNVTNHNKQIHGWLEKIQANITKFKEIENLTDDDRAEFITHQYHLVMLIYKALNGQVIFVGAKPI